MAFTNKLCYLSTTSAAMTSDATNWIFHQLFSVGIGRTNTLSNACGRRRMGAAAAVWTCATIVRIQSRTNLTAVCYNHTTARLENNTVVGNSVILEEWEEFYSNSAGTVTMIQLYCRNTDDGCENTTVTMTKQLPWHTFQLSMILLLSDTQ